MPLPSWTSPRRERLVKALLAVPAPAQGWEAVRVMVDREWRNEESSGEGLGPRAQLWHGQVSEFIPTKKLALSVVEGGRETTRGAAQNNSTHVLSTSS